MIEIAIGIVIAVVILAYLPEIIGLGSIVLVVGIAVLALVVAGIFFYAVVVNPEMNQAMREVGVLAVILVGYFISGAAVLFLWEWLRKRFRHKVSYGVDPTKNPEAISEEAKSLKL